MEAAVCEEEVILARVMEAYKKNLPTLHHNSDFFIFKLNINKL
jgi:hypothetical protein